MDAYERVDKEQHTFWTFGVVTFYWRGCFESVSFSPFRNPNNFALGACPKRPNSLTLMKERGVSEISWDLRKKT